MPMERKKPGWNKGLTKETDVRLAEIAEHISEGVTRSWQDPECRRNHMKSVIHSERIMVVCENPTCKNRDKPVFRSPYVLSKSEHHFCCQECHSEWRRIEDAYPNKRKDRREATSIAMTGHEVSDATRDAISVAKTGKKASEETRAKHRGHKRYKFGLANEKLLCAYFKDVVPMPPGNPGFDFYCAKMYKIDAKGRFLKGNSCQFTINYNITADYFACVLYADREFRAQTPVFTPE